MGRDRNNQQVNLKVLTFQSTRPRGARHPINERMEVQNGVSIHAPAWGATVSHDSLACSISVSIHAPAWGATLELRDTELWHLVSIHAPAWGATPPYPLNVAGMRLFQSTRPRGARLGKINNYHDIDKFQSTRPRGARRAMASGYQRSGQFQSTRPRGARQYRCRYSP